jgi:hypothetical protein
MSDSTFDFNVFISESKDVLVNPKSYFSTMKTSGGIAEPLIKAVIYGVIAGIFYLLWSVLHLGASTGGFFGSAVGVMAFVGAIISAVIGLFVGAVIILVISSICKGSTDFEACTRVAAAIMVIMPINAFFGFISGLNFYAGMIISVAINIYALWLLYNGLVESLKANRETSKIVLYVLIGVMLLFMLLGMGARKRANQFMDSFDNTEIQELLEDLEEN